MYFHKPQEKPRRWGSFQDVQYAIRKNAEKIYQIDPDSLVLAMPLFWGLPPLDYSGKNNHGTNHGVTYQDGRLGFDGSAYIDLGNVLKFTSTDSVTITVRAYPTSLAANSPKYLLSRSNTTTRVDYSLALETDDVIYMYDSNVTDEVRLESNTNVSLNQWQHFTVVLASAQGNIYHDRQNVKSGATQWDDWASTKLVVGAHRTGNSGHFIGFIGDVYINNIALSADRIALSHDLPWALYQPVSRPIYFFQAAGEEPSPGPGLMALMI